MSRTTKKDEKRCMIELLSNMQEIAQRMEFDVDIIEENVKEFLRQMVRINQMYNFNEKEKKTKNTIYMGIHNLLLKYYKFSEKEDGKVTVTIQSEPFLKDRKLITEIEDKINGNIIFYPLNKELDSIENRKKLFSERKKSLKKIREKSNYEELDDIFEYIEVLSLNDVYTIRRFQRAIYQKIKLLKKL